MNDKRLAELKEIYKNRNLLEELAWGIYWNHSGYTSKQNGEFLNWLCLMSYKALKERREKEKWISVKERLPETKDYYLVTVKVKGVYFNDLFYTDKVMYIPIRGWNVDGVIAWQPLPEAYQEEGDQK